MSEEINDGGPALARALGVLDNGAYPSERESQTGMSLRDYFAAKALAGILSKEGSTADRAFGGFAEYAYEMADAMLKARESRNA